MRFSVLAKAMNDIEEVSSTTKKREILAKVLKKVPASEIRQAALLLTGSINPERSQITLGMASRMVLETLSQTYKLKKEKINATFKKKGDVGLLAQDLCTTQKPTLTISQVFKALEKIAKTKGKNSQQQKIDQFTRLLKKATPLETKYLARIVVGKLRLGSSRLLLLDGLALAFTNDIKNKKKIEHAYNVHPDIGEIAVQLKKVGVKSLAKSKVVLASPIKMMLAQRVKKILDIKKHMDLIIAEEKYDGERVQAHKDNAKVTLFSRRLDDITHQYPDVCAAIKKGVKAKRCILDGEVVPVDKKGNYLPFQRLMSRRRKHQVQEFVKEIPVCYMAFDMLSLNNTSTMDTPMVKRRKMLEKTIKESKGIKLARQIQTTDIKKVQKFFKDCIKRGTEGIIAKSGDEDSLYRAGARAWVWIKWKKDYDTDLLDSFDLAVVGAYKGRGKRAGTYGALLCAVYNNKTKKFETLCKLGTGLSDQVLKQLPKTFKNLEVSSCPNNVLVTKAMRPDVWIKPDRVIEVMGAELTKSSTHTCGKEKSKGYALRFPRFIRFREDKSATQATTTKEVCQMAGSR